MSNLMSIGVKFHLLGELMRSKLLFTTSNNGKERWLQSYEGMAAMHWRRDI